MQLVALSLSAMGLVLLGLNPLSFENGLGPGHVAAVVSIVLHLVTVLVCVRKGKFSTALLGVLLLPLAWIGAVRLARPHSRWARDRYDPARTAKAQRRADGLDARFGQWGLDIADLVAGRPSRPSQGSTTGPGRSR